MFEKLIEKGSVVVIKNAAKVVVAIPIAAIGTAGALIAQHLHDKKVYTEKGKKKGF